MCDEDYQKTPLYLRICQILNNNNKSSVKVNHKEITVTTGNDCFKRFFTDEELRSIRYGIKIESIEHNADDEFLKFQTFFDFCIQLQEIFSVLFNYGYTTLEFVCQNVESMLIPDQGKSFIITNKYHSILDDFKNLVNVYGNQIPEQNRQMGETELPYNKITPIYAQIPPFLTVDNIRYFSYLISNVQKKKDIQNSELMEQIKLLLPRYKLTDNGKIMEGINLTHPDSYLSALKLFNNIFSIKDRIIQEKNLNINKYFQEIKQTLINIKYKFLVTNIQILKVAHPVHAYHMIIPITDFFDQGMVNFYQILWCNQKTDFFSFEKDLERSKAWTRNEIFIIVHPEFLNKSEESNMREMIKSRVKAIPDMNLQQILIITSLNNLTDLSEKEANEYTTDIKPDDVKNYYNYTISSNDLSRFSVVYSNKRGDGKTTYIQKLQSEKKISNRENHFIDNDFSDIPSDLYLEPTMVVFTLTEHEFIDNVTFWDQLFGGFYMKIFMRPHLPPFLPQINLNEKIEYLIEVPSSYKMNERKADFLIDFPLSLPVENFIEIEPFNKQQKPMIIYENIFMQDMEDKYQIFFKYAKEKFKFSFSSNEDPTKSELLMFINKVYPIFFKMDEHVPTISLRILSYIEAFLRKIIKQFEPKIVKESEELTDKDKSEIYALFYTLVLYSALFQYNLEPSDTKNNIKIRKIGVPFVLMIYENLLNPNNSDKITFYTNCPKENFIGNVFRLDDNGNITLPFKIQFLTDNELEYEDQILMFQRVASQISNNSEYLKDISLFKTLDLFLPSTSGEDLSIDDCISEMATFLNLNNDQKKSIDSFFNSLKYDNAIQRLVDEWNSKNGKNKPITDKKGRKKKTNQLWKNILKFYDAYLQINKSIDSFEDFGIKLKSQIESIIGDSFSVKSIMNISVSWPYLMRITTLMSRIYIKQPVIMVGETGCGKTSFLRLIKSLISITKTKPNISILSDEYNFRVFDIHGDITHKDINEYLKCKENYIFFDEFNTTKSSSFIEYTMYNNESQKTYIAAMNPMTKTDELSAVFSKVGLPQKIAVKDNQVKLTSAAELEGERDMSKYKYFVNKVESSEVAINCDPIMLTGNENKWLPNEEKFNIRHFVRSLICNSKIIKLNPINTKELMDVFIEYLFETISFIRNLMNERAVISYRDIKSSFSFLEIIFTKLSLKTNGEESNNNESTSKTNSASNCDSSKIIYSVLFTLILSFGLRLPHFLDIDGSNFGIIDHLNRISIFNKSKELIKNKSVIQLKSIDRNSRCVDKSVNKSQFDQIFKEINRKFFNLKIEKHKDDHQFLIETNETFNEKFNESFIKTKTHFLSVSSDDNSNTIVITNNEKENDQLLNKELNNLYLKFESSMFDQSDLIDIEKLNPHIIDLLDYLLYNNEMKIDNRNPLYLEIENICTVDLQTAYLETLVKLVNNKQSIKSPQELIDKFTNFVFWYEWEKIAQNEKNWIFKSFLYHCFIIDLCIQTTNTCFIIGLPGTSKSYAIEQINKINKNIFITTYMCSRTSSAEGLKSQFYDSASIASENKYNKCSCPSMKNFTSVLCSLEEMGLANINEKRPLKFIHFALDSGIDIKLNGQSYQKVPCVGVSNYSMDFANMNRGTLLYTEIPTTEELIKVFEFQKLIKSGQAKLDNVKLDCFDSFESSFQEIFQIVDPKQSQAFFSSLWADCQQPQMLALRSIYTLYRIRTEKYMDLFGYEEKKSNTGKNKINNKKNEGKQKNKKKENSEEKPIDEESKLTNKSQNHPKKRHHKNENTGNEDKEEAKEINEDKKDKKSSSANKQNKKKKKT